MAKDKAVKRVVIIGGGIAGLSAASYLLRNGYEVTVLEKHSQCGGLCTSWKRNGYIIDYCVHWLMGSKKGSEFYQIWDELGAFENADGSPVPIVNFDDFTTIWLSSGEKVCLYSDLEKLRQAGLSSFIFSFNSERPHQGLDYQIPDEVYRKGCFPVGEDDTKEQVA